MAFAIAVALAVVAVLILWVVVAREPGPAPDEVAIAYEQAWARLDYPTLYDLSGDELRDGLRLHDFVAHKRATVRGGPAGPLPRVSVESAGASGDTAHVVTVIGDPGSADSVRNDVLLRRRQGRWVVVSYTLHRAGEPPETPAAGA